LTNIEKWYWNAAGDRTQSGEQEYLMVLTFNLHIPHCQTCWLFPKHQRLINPSIKPITNIVSISTLV
jgi:hypothetical protein